MSEKKNGKTEFVRWLGPILDALRDLGGSAKPKEITQLIGEKYNLSEEVLTDRYEKSGVLRFQNQLTWARQYLVWEELFASSKYPQSHLLNPPSKTNTPTFTFTFTV